MALEIKKNQSERLLERMDGESPDALARRRQRVL
jgi:hypothetical protein